MFYDDQVYGRVQIKEPVLQALLHSAAMQRLTGVLQHGISGLIGITAPITRFEHSVGAMLIVRRYGGGLPEQIAALLHDVSHTALSHVIDYVFDDHDGQGYHDEKKESYLAGTGIPALLAEFGYDWRDFIDETRFSLLEQPAPRLCADRIDYFLRDGLSLQLVTAAEIAAALDDLVVVDGRLACRTQKTAAWFARNYLAADEQSWANFYEVGIYEITARAIRRALAVGVVAEADFWLTDVPFWQKITAGADPELQKWVRLVDPQTKIVRDAAAATFAVSTKLRTIDPDVVVDGRFQPLSTLDTEYAALREGYLRRKAGRWPMRVIGV